MKVIFIKDLKKQGRVNEVKEVSDGYATNYLIKNGYAVKYTKTSSDILNKDLKNIKIKEDNDLAKAKKLAEKLKDVSLKFDVKSNNGKVFGSVSSKQICDELNKIGYSIDKKMIKLDNSLNSLGVHNVCINLHKSVSCDISVMLVEK
ncbi:MAG: 50S ribosomal protein L9 [Bacilli bacterium]|nr:50S ribosomal protein L9 [Bacilli bacterium]